MSSQEEGGISPYAFFAFYSLYNHYYPSKYGIKFDDTLDQTSERLFPGFGPSFNKKNSLFITWKKKSKRDGQYHLRGCIGTFAKLPLYYAIERYSLVAAMEDSRFPPITAKELPLLKCGCNILTNFETIYSKSNSSHQDIYNWEIGKHGIELKFKDPATGEKLSATFLPDVMVEQEWDKEDTFINLIEKAGVFTSIIDIMENYTEYFIEVIRYEGHKSVITYDEFKEKLEELY